MKKLRRVVKRMHQRLSKMPNSNVISLLYFTSFLIEPLYIDTNKNVPITPFASIR